MVDDDTNSIVDCKWQLIPIDEHLAEPDQRLLEFIDSFKEVVDRKYNAIVCKLARELTHPPAKRRPTSATCSPTPWPRPLCAT